MAKTTTAAQYKKLIDLLTEREDIAKGFPKKGKSDLDSFWENVAGHLNSLGPPTKEAQTWRRVWTDYKSYVKKKLAHNKKEMAATGGGPNKLHVLSSLEEEVARITDMRSNVDGVRGLAFGTTATTSMNAEDELEKSDSELQPRRERNIGARVSSKASDSMSLLQKHVNFQEKHMDKINNKLDEVNKNLSDVNSNMKRIYRGIDRMYDGIKASNEEKKRHHKEMEKVEREKLEIKRKKYELQASQLN